MSAAVLPRLAVSRPAAAAQSPSPVASSAAATRARRAVRERPGRAALSLAERSGRRPPHRRPARPRRPARSSRSQRVRAFEQLHLPVSGDAQPRDDHQGRTAASAPPRSSSGRTASKASRSSVDGPQHPARRRPAAAGGHRARRAHRPLRHLRAAGRQTWRARRRRSGVGRCRIRRSTRSRTTSRGCSPRAQARRRRFSKRRFEMRRSSIAPGWRSGKSGPSRATTRRRSRRCAPSRRSRRSAFHARFFAGISLIELKRYDESARRAQAVARSAAGGTGRRRPPC